jgi:cytochrome c5
MKTQLLLSVAIVAFSITGCGNNESEEKEKQHYHHSEKTSPHPKEAVTMSVQQFEGMKLFMRHCNKCHPGGEQGKGPSLNDKPLPNFIVHWQVRLGVGDMPKFTEEQISTTDVDKIKAFVRMMREMTME